MPWGARPRRGARRPRRAELDSFHFEQLHRTDVRHTEFALNWKLANDTGFEVYHVSFLHKDSVGPLNIGNTAVYERFGPNHRMATVSPSALDLRGEPETDWQPLHHMQLIYNIFPSTGMVVSPLMVALTRTDPGPTPSTSRFRFSTYSWAPFDAPAMAELATMAFEGLYSVVSTEDFVAAARTQANLDAGSLDHGLVGQRAGRAVGPRGLRPFHRRGLSGAGIPGATAST